MPSHKLLKTLGSSSEYTKGGQSLTKIKQFEIINLCSGYDGMQKTISRYFPFNARWRILIVWILIGKFILFSETMRYFVVLDTRGNH